MQRKRSRSRRLVSKERIEQAKYAKRAGLLSKRAKLTQQRLSLKVRNKIAALEELRAVPTYTFREGARRPEPLDVATRGSVKVKPSIAQRARLQGFQVFNNRIIANKSILPRVRVALKDNRLAGTTLAPNANIPQGRTRLAAGTAERIQLSRYGIRNFKDLFDALQGANLQNIAKDPREYWAFTLYGFNIRPERHKEIREAGREAPDMIALNFLSFRSDADLLNYLQRYSNITDCTEDDGSPECEELFKSFELYRLEEGENLGSTPDSVYENYRRSKGLPENRRQRRRRQYAEAKAKRQTMTTEQYRERVKEQNRKYYQRKVNTVTTYREERALQRRAERQARASDSGRKVNKRPNKRKY